MQVSIAEQIKTGFKRLGLLSGYPEKIAENISSSKASFSPTRWKLILTSRLNHAIQFDKINLYTKRLPGLILKSLLRSLNIQRQVMKVHHGYLVGVCSPWKLRIL